MDDRDRRAPVALAADAPVAQPPGRLLAAQALVLQRLGDGVDRHLVGQTAVVVGVDGHGARAAHVFQRVPVLPLVVVEVRFAFDMNDLQDVDAVLFREREVALVVAGHAHHGAVAVADQHVVADPDRNRLVCQRVVDEQAGVDALLFLRRQFGLGGAAGLAFGDERGDLRVACRRVQRQRVLGCHGAEGHAHDGVGAGREDKHAPVGQRLTVGALDGVREGEAHAFALADPVLLHQLHALGPARQVVLHLVEQLVGVGRDVQVVAGNLALFDRRATAPATAVDHLFVGEHGLVDRVPVDDLGAAFGDAGAEHLQEQPLVPLVVARVTARDFAAPVDGQAHGLHLLLHVGDVVVRPLRRRHAVFHRRVLGRQAEGVPAHRHQHVHALHAQLAREHVVDGVVAYMAHVQLATGVGQHRAGIKLRAARVFDDAVSVGSAPGRLRGTLDFVGFEVGIHGVAPRAEGTGIDYRKGPPFGAPRRAPLSGGLARRRMPTMMCPPRTERTTRCPPRAEPG